MEFTLDEIEKTKAMLMYMVTKLHKQSDGHSGFHISMLQPILEQLVEDGKLQKRRTINNDKYFLILKNP